MEISGIYDNGPISPVARIKDHISVYTAKKWSHYEIAYAEPWPRSSPLRVDMVALSGAVVIAANAILAKRLVPIVQVTDGEMLQLRFLPLDDVEAVIYEQSGTAKFNSRNTHARVNMTTGLHDPYLATTTTFVLGYQRDLNIEIQNPNPVPINQARLQFWGFRYVLDELMPSTDQAVKKLLSDGDKAAVAQYIGPTTWLPAEGR